ncbi:E3 ubiquitin-protein ligase RNF4 [Melia azedarach]|uniref:E3 ubiquitin-protein ligase RNF4 n=1 Tax=Melia azedarach TaxID=155640 RepID=A0ACC1Z0U2_MELAZ|nr:E3 ubiquitin-protein ligase RNF4 [Melia azedarach]
MSTQAARGPPLRGYRRRKAVPDLNVPPIESRDQEGSSTESRSEQVQASRQVQSIPPAPIDVEAIDDDVIESSPRAFAEAKNNSRRNRGRAFVVDVDSERTTGLAHNNRNKRRRVSPNTPVINCDFYINLESTSHPARQNAAAPPLPPKEPTFTCPICMGPLVEEMSTKCGHIFCKTCIRSAIAAQAKCPTCRKKVTVKELIRVFLPATS